MHERISLITMVFSDPNQVRIAGDLSGDDAQAFVDKIDEASSVPAFCLESMLINSVGVPLLSCWIVSRNRYTESVCVICTRFVVAKPWFRDH